MADRQQRMSTQSVSWEVEETDDPISGRITQVDESTIKLPGGTTIEYGAVSLRGHRRSVGRSENVQNCGELRRIARRHTCSFDERSSRFTASLRRSNSVSLALRAQELSVAAADGMRRDSRVRAV